MSVNRRSGYSDGDPGNSYLLETENLSYNVIVLLLSLPFIPFRDYPIPFALPISLSVSFYLINIRLPICLKLQLAK